MSTLSTDIFNASCGTPVHRSKLSPSKLIYFLKKSGSEIRLPDRASIANRRLAPSGFSQKVVLPTVRFWADLGRFNFFSKVIESRYFIS
jgi:hypothetical protein